VSKPTAAQCHCRHRGCVAELIFAYDKLAHVALALNADADQATADRVTEEVFGEAALQWVRGKCPSKGAKVAK
jgi:hypothetical protein